MVERVITAQAAGNLQLIRRGIARGVMGLIFGITVLLATLLLSNLAEEKTSKVIEILAAAVPLDAVFLGKLIAMLGISFVGLAVWGGMYPSTFLKPMEKSIGAVRQMALNPEGSRPTWDDKTLEIDDNGDLVRVQEGRPELSLEEYTVVSQVAPANLHWRIPEGGTP